MRAFSLSRIYELLVCLIALFLLSPLTLIILPLFFIILQRPIFFRQIRLGKNLDTFSILKLRTIDRNIFEKGVSISKIGKFFRYTSVDELPSLINILFGKMTFIGPRPLLIEDGHILLLICPERFSVLPGLTGLVQVFGRNRLSWRRRLALDFVYCKKSSFCLNVVICFLTINTVSRAGGLQVLGTRIGKPLKWELNE